VTSAIRVPSPDRNHALSSHHLCDLSHSLDRSIISCSQSPPLPRQGLDRSRRRQPQAKSSVHRRGSQTLRLKIPKNSNCTWTQSDEDGHAIDTPLRQTPPCSPPRNPHYRRNTAPCCHQSHDRSNDDFKALTTAIQEQIDILNQILSATTAIPHTPTKLSTVSLSSVFMPRPGQPGSLDVFTGDNISNCLDEYNTECELYGFKPERRAILLPRYCTPEIKEIVTLLPGYESRNWTLLQTEIKKFYWKSDRPKNTLAALDFLVCSESTSIPLRVFILKFSVITDALIANNFLFPVNRIVKLLEGLDGKMRSKVIKFCVQNGWKVSDEDNGEAPDFDEIKKFLEHEALTMDRISVYNRDHCFPAASNDTTSNDTVCANPHLSDTPPITVTKPTATDTVNPVSTLSSIPLTAPTPISPPAPTTITAIPTSSSRRIPRVSRCIWCDSPDHSRRSVCVLFAEALKSGNIRINEVGYVVLSSTGAEFPPAFGRGGMKRFYDAVCPPPAPSHGLPRMSVCDDQISA
jgi:hypothetical protein